MLGNRPQCYAVVDASFTMAPSPISNIYKVFDNLQILWIAYGGCIVTMISPLTLAKLLEFYQDLWMLLGNNNKSQHVLQCFRLYTHLLTHQLPCIIFLICLTTFKWCGCAYGCILTIILPLSLTKQSWEFMENPNNARQPTTALCSV